MKLNDMKWDVLGSFIDNVDERNTDGLYTVDDVRGLSIDKKFIPTKANMTGVSLKPYKLVKPGSFCYVTITSRNSEKITLAYNDSDSTYLVSSSYEVFKLKNENDLIPEFLYLWFVRPEFNRYSRFHSWGSAREAFSHDDMKRVRIPVPSIEQQRAVVDAWKSLRKIKEENEALAAPLMQLCQSYVQDCKHKYPMTELREFIEDPNLRNKNGYYGVENLMGVNCEGNFIITKANTDGLNFNNYKVVKSGEFAYSNRINIGSIALNRGADCIVSPSYAVFRLTDQGKIILPDYLALWFRRPEFLRSTLFFAFGTIKDDFSFDNMKSSRIPLPPISVQTAIVTLYNCALEYQTIAAEADAESRRICPALLQHVINN